MFQNPYNHYDNLPSSSFVSWLKGKGLNSPSNQISDELYTKYVWDCQDDSPFHTCLYIKPVYFGPKPPECDLPF